MKIKAVFWGQDRQTRVYILPRKKIEGNTFRHEDCIYFLDADRFMISSDRKYGWKRNFKTFYYKRGMSQPLPVPNFDFTVKDENGNILIPEIVDNGISAEELAAKFNPWFYRIIGSLTKDVWEQIQFYLVIGNTIALAYLIWRIHALPNEIAKLIPSIPPVG